MTKAIKLLTKIVDLLLEKIVEPQQPSTIVKVKMEKKTNISTSKIKKNIMNEYVGSDQSNISVKVIEDMHILMPEYETSRSMPEYVTNSTIIIMWNDNQNSAMTVSYGGKEITDQNGDFKPGTTVNGVILSGTGSYSDKAGDPLTITVDLNKIVALAC